MDHSIPSAAHKPRILVVADVEIAARGIESQLVGQGYELAGHTTHGARAIALAAELRPDVVLVDIGLTDSHNIMDTAATIRKQLSLPVVFLTASVEDSTQTRAKPAGQFGYISKPFSAQELRVALELALYKHQVETKLRKSEERLRMVLLGSRDGIWDRDLITDEVYYSPRWFEILGYGANELPVSTDLWTNLMHPDDVQGAMQQVAEVHASDAANYELVVRLRHKAGHYVPVLSRGFVVRDADGRAARAVGTSTDLTSRRKADAQRRESDQRFRTIFEAEPECVKVLGPAGDLLEMNDAGLAMLEAGSVSEAKAHGLLNFVLPAYRSDFTALHQRVMAGNNGLLEFEVAGLRGTRRRLETHAAPMRNAEGNVTMLLGITRDITARKRAEDQLRVSDFALKAISQSVIITGPDRLINWANAAFLAMTGYASEEINGRNCRFLQGPLSDPDTISAIRFGLESYGAFSGEILNYRKDGTTFWNDLTISPVRDERGELTHFIGVMRDMTARKLAEEQLRVSDIVLESVSQGLIVTGADRRILSANAAFIAVTGYSSEEILGRDCKFLQGPLSEPLTIKAIHHAVATGSEFSGEILNYRKDGTTFWNDLTISPVRNERGELTHFVGVTRDISGRKRIEAERVSLEAQLRESQKMQAIGTLAGGIAHDFNNILATILGNAELARQDLSNNPLALESLQEIHKAGSRARDLVQQILSFSRRQPTERKPIALFPVINESVRLLRAMLPARVALDIQVESDVPVVLADATQIEQLVINLATNAMQAMAGRPGRVEIRLATVMVDTALANTQPSLLAYFRVHPGRAVRITVIDNGPGMDATTLERIFEPFFTTKPVDEGTGLGLSVVHGIVQAHEGAITVESQPGKGATFTLYLPATNEIASNMGVPNASAAVAVPAGSSAVGPHILYLDDDESLIFLVTRLLERRGYRVSGYTEQKEALAALRVDPGGFDLVVTDYNMPGMSGLDVARAVRTIREDLPVAVASGFIDEALRAQAEGSGVRELIFKASAVNDFCDALVRLAPAR